MGQGFRTFLRILGGIYLAAAICIILLGYGMIAYKEGFPALAEILSPLNIIGYAAVVITLAPGLILMHFGRKRSSV